MGRPPEHRHPSMVLRRPTSSVVSGGGDQGLGWLGGDGASTGGQTADRPGGALSAGADGPQIGVAVTVDVRGLQGCKGRTEAAFLDPLDEIAQSGKTAAENLLTLYNGSWHQDVTRVFRDFAY